MSFPAAARAAMRKRSCGTRRNWRSSSANAPASKPRGISMILFTQRSALIMYRVDAQKRLHETIDSLTRLQDRLTYLSKVRPQLSSEIRSVHDRPESGDGACAADAVRPPAKADDACWAPTARAVPWFSVCKRRSRRCSALCKTWRIPFSRVTTSVSPITTAIDQELINSKAEIAPLAGSKGALRENRPIYRGPASAHRAGRLAVPYPGRAYRRPERQPEGNA